MTPNQAAVLLPATTLLALLAVVACGPNKDYVPVSVVSSSEFTKAVDSCSNEIRKSQTLRIQGATKTSPICIADPESKKYQLVDQEAGYKVSRLDRGLQIAIDVGVKLPKDISSEDVTAVNPILYKECLPMLESVFERSLRRVQMQMNFKLALTFKAFKEGANYDQVIELASANNDDDESSFVMAHWPHESRLYPKGKASALAICAETHEKGTDSYNACVRQARETANLGFCQSLGQMVGHWLGLNAPNNTHKRCGGREQGRSASTYMQMAAGVNAKEFFSKGFLSQYDVKSVLSPVCDSFRRRNSK